MGNQSETIIQSKPNTGLTEFDLYAGEIFLKYWGAGKHERKKSVLKFVLEQQVEIEMWDIVGELERSESKSTDRASRAQYISKTLGLLTINTVFLPIHRSHFSRAAE